MTDPQFALSIRQPWAWLIVRPDITLFDARHNARAVGKMKPVENRTWATKFRGPVWIHAAKTMTRADYEACVDFVACFDYDLAAEIPDPGEFDFGGIIGRARLTNCFYHHSSVWFCGPFGHYLEEVEPVPFRPCKGALGFFKPQLT